MNKWVSTKIKLPNPDDIVLVYFLSGGLSPVEAGYYDDSWFVVSGDKCHQVDAAPSHWMPLPQAPEAP